MDRRNSFSTCFNNSRDSNVWPVLPGVIIVTLNEILQKRSFDSKSQGKEDRIKSQCFLLAVDSHTSK